MGKKRKRVKYHNKFSMYLLAILLFLVSIFFFNEANFLKKEKAQKIEVLKIAEKKLEKAKQRELELVEFEKYTQTKKFYEEVAKEKLGLVYRGEIIFRAREK